MKESNDDLRPKEVRRRHTLLMIAGLISVPFILLVVFFIAINFRTFWPVEPIISPETTVITGPLKSDGRQVDYFAAIEGMYYTPEMKTEANGFRTLVATYGAEPFLWYLDPEMMSILCEQLYEKLGLEPVLDPKPFIVDPYNFLTKHAEENGLDTDELTEQFSSEWEPPLFSILEEWLNEADPVLVFYTEQLHKDVFIIPMLRESDDEVFYYTDHLSAMGRAFHTRAKIRLSKGDIDGAMDARIACMKLGRFMMKCPNFKNTWGIRLERTANRIPIGIGNNPPNTQQILRCRKAIADLPEQCEEHYVIEVFRYNFLEEIQNARDGKSSYYFKEDMNSIFHHDWNLVMRDFNKKFDLFPDEWERASMEINRPKTFFDLLTPASRAEVISNKFAWEAGSGLTYYITSKRLSCEYEINDIVFAMLLYKEEHGTLPPAWTVDENGRPMHSWRVLILPYLGQNELYEKIRLDEPWDSEHNSRFHKTEIAQYRCGYFDPPPSPGETPYAVVFGENLAFDDSGKGKSISELGPKSDKMALVVERKTTVNWMRPEKEIAKSDIRPEIVSSVFEEWAKVGFVNGTVATFGTEPCEDFLAELEGIIRP